MADSKLLPPDTDISVVTDNVGTGLRLQFACPTNVYAQGEAIRQLLESKENMLGYTAVPAADPNSAYITLDEPPARIREAASKLLGVTDIRSESIDTLMDLKPNGKTCDIPMASLPRKGPSLS